MTTLESKFTLLTGCPDPDAAKSIHITTQHDPVKFKAVKLWLPTRMSTSCDSSSAFLQKKKKQHNYNSKNFDEDENKK